MKPQETSNRILDRQLSMPCTDSTPIVFTSKPRNPCTTASLAVCRSWWSPDALPHLQSTAQVPRNIPQKQHPYLKYGSSPLPPPTRRQNEPGIPEGSIPVSGLYSHRLTGWGGVFSWVSQDNSFPKPPLIELWGLMLIDRVGVMGYRDWKAVPVGQILV